MISCTNRKPLQGCPALPSHVGPGQTRRGRFPGRPRRRGRDLGSACPASSRGRDGSSPHNPRRGRICNVGKSVFAPGLGRVWRRRHKTHSAPARIDRKAVLWASGDLNDLPVIQSFVRGNRRRVGRLTSACRETRTTSRLVFRVDHSPSTRDDVLARAAIAKLTAFTTAHGTLFVLIRKCVQSSMKRDACTCD